MKDKDKKINYLVIDQDKFMQTICNPPSLPGEKRKEWDCEWNCPYCDHKTDKCVIYEFFKEAEKNNHMLALNWIFDPIRYIDRKKGIDEKRDAYLCPGCNLHSFVSEQYCPHCGAFMKNGKS